MTDDIFKALAAPFPAKEIEWRIGSTTKDKSRGMALAYISARAVMDRLDEVVGPMNWRDIYEAGPAGGVLCRLSLNIPDADGEDCWNTKEDAAENTDFEPVKGGISDAFKRAAVKWGIGRYLYHLDSPWVDLDDRGRFQNPRLPAWALPEGETPAQAAPAKPQTPFEERMGQRQQQAERKRDFPAKTTEVREDIGGPKPRPEVLAVVKQLTADLGAPHLKAWFEWQELPLSEGVKLNGVALRAGEWLDREQLEIPSLIASINEFEMEVVDA